MRLMYDAIYPSNIPKGAAIVASYVDGKWPNYSEAVALFPHALHVSIAVFAKDNALALDVERYDASPQEAPGWVARQRKRGVSHPIVYMSAAMWPQVKAEFSRQGVPEPLYWVADYNGKHEIPAGAIAHQFQGTTAPGYDVSVIADYVPGLDHPVPNEREDLDMSTEGDAIRKDIADLKQFVHDIYSLPDAKNPKIRHQFSAYTLMQAAVHGIPAWVKAILHDDSK